MSNRESRYERRGDMYALQTWGAGGRPVYVHGALDTAPQWLKEITAIARVGGYMRKVQVSPPDEILWFITTETGEFVQFSGASDV